MAKNTLIIATRESKLARWQAAFIGEQLKRLHPTLTITYLGLTTQGDKRLDVALKEVGGKGLFVKELEDALLLGRADIAVHSMKDVPMVLPAGLILPVMTERADPRDVFIANGYASLDMLPHGARMGTSSLRRQLGIARLRPDLSFLLLRGNIDTRLSKLDRGEYDAILLAASGLSRLELADRIKQYLPITTLLPAAGQGALGIECREADVETLALIAPLMHRPTQLCVQAERDLCRYLDGGCHLPLAAYALIEGDHLSLTSCLYSADPAGHVEVAVQVPLSDADKAGTLAAKMLIAKGFK